MTGSTFTVGKSDEKQIKKRAHKAIDGESKHKATGGESKHRENKPSVEAIGSRPFVMTFEATDDGGLRHSQWRDHFRQLCEYKVQCGHCLVPKQYSANPTLGQWVSTQRTRYRNNTEDKSTSITAERIRALDGIGFYWGTSKHDLASLWNVRFQELCQFKAQFGDCLVPKHYSATPKLGKWVSNQRARYRNNTEEKATSISSERIRALDGIGFDWGTSKTDLASIWNVRFKELCHFKALFGDCVVSLKYSANPKLGQWVSKQRSNYRLFQEGKASPITAERIEELESLEFKWEQHYVSWNERFEQLRALTVQCGHCVVPLKYAANPKLSQWVLKQRSNYRLFKEGKPSPMTAERIRELESLEFKWERNYVSRSEQSVV